MNELECDGINAASARDTNEKPNPAGSVVGADDAGIMTNSQTWVGMGNEGGLAPGVGVVGVVDNEGGRVDVGVGGYECVLELETDVLSGLPPGMPVLTTICSAPSALRLGNSDMNVPGGNARDRMRMYHPRFGRCIVQHIVDVGLC